MFIEFENENIRNRPDLPVVRIHQPMNAAPPVRPFDEPPVIVYRLTRAAPRPDVDPTVHDAADIHLSPHVVDMYSRVMHQLNDLSNVLSKIRPG